jgi:hypothetical protein
MQAAVPATRSRRTTECSPQAGCPVSRPKMRRAPSGKSAGPPRLPVLLKDVAGSFPGILTGAGLAVLRQVREQVAGRLGGTIRAMARAVDTRAARLVAKAAATTGACLRPRSDPRGPGARRIGRVMQARRCAHPLRAAQPGKRSADRPVCTSMWITCAKRHQACGRAVEMLGIRPPGRPLIRVLSWEDTSHTLCTPRKPELSTHHAAIAHK